MSLKKEKKVKELDFLHKQIKESEVENDLFISAIHKEQKKEFEIRISQKRYEADLYRKFLKANKGRRYIDIEHIDALKLEYDVLFITSEKNIGKNVGIIYKTFEKYHKQGEKIIFVRSSKIELEETVSQYNATPSNPLFFKKKGALFNAFHKESEEHCGIFKEFKTINRMSAGEFENYGAIIYDECCPWTTTELNRGHYYGFAAVLSSVTRSKKTGVKVFCIGNIVGTNLGMLDFYGIRKNDKLRYFQRGTDENPCRILYINVDGVYTGGISNQVGAVQGMSAEFRHQLNNNSAEISSSLILKTDLWDQFEPYQSFIVKQRRTQTLLKIVVEIRRTPINVYESNPIIYYVKCQAWNPAVVVEGSIYTDCPIIASGAKNTVFLHNISLKKFILYDAARANNLRFYDPTTEEICQQIIQNLDINEKYKHGF